MKINCNYIFIYIMIFFFLIMKNIKDIIDVIKLVKSLKVIPL